MTNTVSTGGGGGGGDESKIIWAQRNQSAEILDKISQG